MNTSKIGYYLRISSASFIFLAFGIWEIINPEYWQGFVPSVLFKFNITLLILAHGIVLAILGAWLLTGKWLKAAAVTGTIIMAQIVISLFLSSGFSDLLVRDFAIMLFVLSLAFENNNKEKRVK